MARVPTDKNNPTAADLDEPVSLYVEDADPEEVLRALLTVRLEDDEVETKDS